MHTGMHPTNRYIVNRCLQKCISPADACRNAYLQQMHTGMHLTNMCMQESISQTDVCGNASHQPTDACGSTYCQQMHAGMHLTMKTAKNLIFWPTHVLNQYLVYTCKGILIPLVKMGRAFN